MANVQTINRLVLRIRQRSDQLNSATFDDTTELKLWLRGSLSQLYQILNQRAKDYYTTARPISLMQGQEAYSLPSDFSSLADMWVLQFGGTTRRQMRNFSPDEFGQIKGGDYRYRLMRNLLFIQPVPTADFHNALEMHYIPHYRAPLLDYSPIDEVMPDGWEEWAVLDVMQKMSVKTRLQNMDDILKTKAAVEARLVATAAIRDGFAPVMRDGRRPRTPTWPYQLVSAPNGPLYWAIP